MSSKFFIATIFFFEFISISCDRNEGDVRFGITPNVTGLIPNVTISRTTSLYDGDINMSLTVYQRPVNNTLKQTLRVLNVSTNVDSTNRCIVFSGSFSLWGQYPIINSQATGNGGCDAILGRACSQSILKMLRNNFGNFDDEYCRDPSPNILRDYPEGCPPPKSTSYSWRSSIFMKNGSFMTANRSKISFYDKGDSSASVTSLRFLENGLFMTANSTQTLIYAQSAPSVNDDYDDLMKDLVFTYFVGRPLSSGIIDSAIACFSFDDTTVVSNTRAQLSDIATQLFVSGKLLIFLSLLHVFARFIVYLP